MKYKIELTENFRPRGGFYTPGVYRVPEDLSEDLAEQAVKEGGAKRLEKPEKFRHDKHPYARKVLPAAPENKSEVDGNGDSGSNRPVPYARGRGRPAKQDSSGDQ